MFMANKFTFFVNYIMTVMTPYVCNLGLANRRVLTSIKIQIESD